MLSLNIKWNTVQVYLPIFAPLHANPISRSPEKKRTENELIKHVNTYESKIHNYHCT